MRREVAARAGQQRHAERRRDRQRPHGVGLGLLLERDRQHPAVHARPGPGWPRRSRSRRRPSPRCAPAAAACRPRRARRPGTARASSRPRTGRAPCRPRPRRCRPGRARRRPAPGPPPRGTARRSTRRPAGDRCRVWPTPSTAARCCRSVGHRVASITQTRFCCRAGPLVAWPSARSGAAGHDLPRGQADPGQPGREHRVAAQRAARRVDPRRRRPGRARRAAELLVA